MRKIIILSLLSVMIFSNLCFAQEEQEKINIAIGKKVTADNTHGASYVASKAVDGNSSSIWSSPDDGGDFIIDLGGMYAIQNVELMARQNMDQPFEFPYIYGSSSDDFIQFDVLSELEATVPAKGTMSTNIESNKKYRYLKLTFSDYATVAELRIFEKDLPETQINAVEINYPDVTDVKLRNTLGLLGGFGIEIPSTGESEFFENKEVTRAQFCDLVVKTIGIENISDEKTPFKDIAGIIQQNSIKALYSLDAVEEYAAGLFKPDLSIDIYEAAKIVVKALGYSNFAKQTLNSELTLRKKVSELNLMKNVSGRGKMTRKDAAFMLENALNAEILDIEVIGNNSIEYTRGKTLLNCRGYYCNEGIVTENYNMSFNQEWKGVAEGRVVIEDTVYDVAYNNLMYHVGDKVRYYYNENEAGTKTIIFMHRVESQKELIISADDIESLSGRTIKYRENDKQKIKSFIAGARVIYNGRPLTENKNISTFKPKNGHIRMVDYDGNGTYETVIILNYEDRVVKRVNKKECTYFFEAGKPSVTVSEEKTAVYYRNGKIASPLSIKAGDVLSIGTSLDKKHYEIYISSSYKEGKITEISQGINKKITIDYLRTYPVSNDFNSPDDIKLGERGVLYINYEGKAAFFEIEKFSAYRYGFLTNAGIEGVFSEELKIQVYTQEGNLEVITVRKNSILDGKVYTSPKTVLTDLENRLLNSNGKYVDCLIRYRIDINLEISEIDTLYSNGATEGFSKVGDITDKYIMYGVFDGKYILDENTTVFYAYDETNPEERYEVRTVSNSFKDRNYYTLEVYGETSEILNPLPVVIVRKQNKEADVGDDAYAVLVDDVVKGLNKNEDVVPVVCGMYKGEYVKLPFADSLDVPSWISYLDFGDVIRITTNKYNEISVCEFTGEYTDTAPETDTVLNIKITPKKGSHMSPRFMMFGGIYDLSDTLLCMKPGLDMEVTDDFHIVHTGKFENVYLCDTKEQKVKKGTYDEITDYISDNMSYSYVFCRLNSGYHRDLIIYSR